MFSESRSYSLQLLRYRLAVSPAVHGRPSRASAFSNWIRRKTLVEFRLGGTLHTTHGQFQLKRGTIEADSDTGKAEGAIVVDAASGDSGDSLRDNRMRDSILEAAKYPEITFSPRHIDGHLELRGGFRAKLQGLLKLHGVDHEITIDTQGTLIEDNLIGTAHFSIPYVEWGLKDPSVLFLAVAKRVEIDIATAGRVRWLPRKASAQRSMP